MQHSDSSSNQQNKQENVHVQSLQQQQNKQAYITQPHQYLEYCVKDKKIKVMDQCNPILPYVYLKDISLHKKGPLEDKIYSKNNKYYWNIRRGNTLCQIYNQNQQQKDLFMCRRGMKKFYDLQPQYLKINRNLTYQHQRYRKRIFQKLDAATNTSGIYKIHLYGLFKQNGQHCQISYIHQLDMWLFASKNVAILARNPEDLENHYQKQRFYWAKLIGHEFFKILQNKFTQQQKKQFINDIKGKTLLGQHCGYEQHQHITKYQNIQIIFYGLVQNNGNQHCLPVSQCEQFLKKYGLKMSAMQKYQNLADKHKIYGKMYEMLSKVAQGTMQECGEGSVMYIVAENLKTKQQKNIGMCKLKTCQYLIYRKMREMIKIYFAKKGSTANSFEKFKFQIESLCNSYFKPPNQLQHYFDIAQQAFNQVQKRGKQFSDNEFRYKFVNFLNHVMKKAQLKQKNQQEISSVPKRIVLVSLPLLNQQSHEIQKFAKKHKIPIQYAYRQANKQKLTKNILHVIHMAPRMTAQLDQDTLFIINRPNNIEKTVKQIAQQLEQMQNIKKSHMISFIKSEDKVKSLTLLSEKIELFEDIVKQKNASYKIVKDSQQLITQIKAAFLRKQETLLSQKNNKNQTKEQIKNYNANQKIQKDEDQDIKIFVIMTMTIPGSGKSTLAQKLHQLCQFKGMNMVLISSDKIRQKVMEKYRKKNKNMDDQHIYQNTKKTGLQAYRNAINTQLNQIPQQTKIIFIDRVFCPTTIFENIQEMNRKWIKFIILIQSQNMIKFNDYTYPHSMTYLLTCLKRSLQRQQHQTLSTKPVEIVKVVLKFYQMYRGFQYKKLARQLQDKEINFQLLGLPFIDESQQVMGINQHLKRKVQQCLKQISPGKDAPDSELYAQLIEIMYKYSEHIERKSTQEAQKNMVNLLNKNIEKILKLLQ